MMLLVARDRSTQILAGTAFEGKGRDKYQFHGSVRPECSGGSAWCFDQTSKPSFLALLPRAALNLPCPPEGNHAANDFAEVSVWELKGQTTVVRSQLQSTHRREHARPNTKIVWEMLEAAPSRICRERAVQGGRDFRTRSGLYLGHHERSGALFLTLDGLMQRWE